MKQTSFLADPASAPPKRKKARRRPKNHAPTPDLSAATIEVLEDGARVPALCSGWGKRRIFRSKKIDCAVCVGMLACERAQYANWLRENGWIVD